MGWASKYNMKYKQAEAATVFFITRLNRDRRGGGGGLAWRPVVSAHMMHDARPIPMAVVMDAF